jgi:Tol biopolymer transport system component
MFVAKPPLTGFNVGDRSPTISPNADVMVFTRGGNTAQRLYYGVRNSDVEWKTGVLTVPDAADDLDTDPELSPDGCQLFVASKRGTQDGLRDIHAFPITGRR